MLFLTVSSSSSFTTLPRAIKSLRSKPAQKAFPSPERIITWQSGSFPNRLNASPISLKKKTDKEDKIFANSRWKAFNVLGKDPDCRVIFLSGNEKAFRAGIDLNDLMALGSDVNDDELNTGRKNIKLITVQCHCHLQHFPEPSNN